MTGHWSESKRNIIVEVFPTNGEESISSLFSAINAAEPVRLIDLPDSDNTDSTSFDVLRSDNVVASKEEARSPQISAQGNLQVTSRQETVISTDDNNNPKSKAKPQASQSNKELQAKEIVTITAEILRQKYPEMFKPTSRCKIPHLNIDVFRDDLFSTAMIQQGQCDDSEQLLKQLQKINDRLKAKFDQLAQDENRAKGFTKSFQSALEKAKSNGFYLGMEKDWLYEKSMWT